MQKLYLIECERFMKIGVAYDVQKRLAELSTGNPFELRVLAVYGFENAQVIEAALHQRFSNGRIRGEWFSLSEEDVKIFHVLCEGLGGLAIPVNPTVEETEMENSENEILYAQQLEQEQQQKLDQESRIIELYHQGKSQSQIEQEVFGYRGGAAAFKVSSLVKQIKAINTKDRD
jgi:T5orf172 domain.